MLNTRQLRYVQGLAEHRNFARAAKTMGISQPALSRSIQKLEENLGVKLFERNKKGAFLTEAGQIVLKHARLITGSTTAMKNELDRYHGLMFGSLNIGTGSYAGTALLPRAIAQFNQLYPDIYISATIIDWIDLTDKIMLNDLDFVVMESSEVERSSNIEFIELNRQQVYFYARVEHPLFKQKNLSILDLVDYPFMMPVMPQRVKGLFTKLFNKDPDGRSPDLSLKRIFVGDQTVIKQTIARSNAIGVGTVGMLEAEMDQSILKILPFFIPKMTMHADIIRRKGLSASPAATAFIDILHEIDADQLRSTNEFLRTVDFQVLK